MPAITFRPATLDQGDDVRMVDFFNSQLNWLRTVGSQDQWTSQATTDPDSPRYQKLRHWILQSEETVRDDRPFTKDWCRAFVAEVDIPVPDESTLSPEQTKLCQNGRLPVCCMILTGRASDYTQRTFTEQDQEDPFVFLQLLVTDRRAGQWGRGTGAAAVEYAKEQIRRVGVKRFVGDCYGGNERRLIKFYESCGFQVIDEYAVGEQKWPVCCFGMRL